MKAKLLVILVMLGGPLVDQAQLTYEHLLVQYDSALTYDHLRLIPIRWKGPGSYAGAGLVSFSEALRQGWVRISERGTASTENVHWLRINNKSKHPVFIASGEVVLGGRQDRMVSKDTVLVPDGHDQYIPVMCVEEGRWSEREKKFTYFNFANASLRKTLDGSGNQVVLWREIIRQLDSNRIRNDAFEYAATRLNKKNIPREQEYLKFFLDSIRAGDSSWVGMVCVSGNKVIGTEIFSGSPIFYQELEALLAGYVEEALYFGSPPVESREKIKNYLDRFLMDEAQQALFLRKHGKLFRYQGRVFHLLAFAEEEE